MSFIGRLSLRTISTDDSTSALISRVSASEPIDSDPVKILAKSTAPIVVADDPAILKAAVDVYKAPSTTTSSPPPPVVKTAVAPTPSSSPVPAPIPTPGAPLPPPPVVNIPNILPGPGAPGGLLSKKLLGVPASLLIGGAGLLTLAVLLRRRKK